LFCLSPASGHSYLSNSTDAQASFSDHNYCYKYLVLSFKQHVEQRNFSTQLGISCFADPERFRINCGLQSDLCRIPECHLYVRSGSAIRAMGDLDQWINYFPEVVGYVVQERNVSYGQSIVSSNPISGCTMGPNKEFVLHVQPRFGQNTISEGPTLLQVTIHFVSND
jgi:hypothetical protein